jgi:hypothetical protein
MAAKNDPTSYDDEEENDDFDAAKPIHDPDADLWRECVHCCDEQNDSNSDSTLHPCCASVPSGNNDVGCKHNAPAGRESEKYCLSAENYGCEQLWTLVHGFEVNLFTARPWEHCSKLEPDKHAGK